jgi:hypothetical membrane protein
MTDVPRGDMPIEGRARNRLLAWGIVGVIAQIAFMAGWLIAETWQGPKYSSIKYTISDLQAATAPHVWFIITCFAAGGLGTFGFAVFGLRPALSGAGKIAAYAPWMLALSTLALGNSFPLIPFRLVDPGATANLQLHSAGGLTDAIVAGIAFLVLALTPFPLLRRLAVLPEWRRLKPVMLTAGVFGPVCYILFGVFQNSSVEGLMERILVTVCVAWICVVAVNLILVSRHAGSRPAGGA